jgi:hypothetical protein
MGFKGVLVWYVQNEWATDWVFAEGGDRVV